MENQNMIVKGFELVNVLKVERAVAAVGDQDEAALLAEYDKLGGLIRYNGENVITGCFWDFTKKMPVAEPKPRVKRVQKPVVEVEVEEIEIDAKPVAKKATKKTTKKVVATEVEEDEEEGTDAG